MHICTHAAACMRTYTRRAHAYAHTHDGTRRSETRARVLGGFVVTLGKFAWRARARARVPSISRILRPRSSNLPRLRPRIVVWSRARARAPTVAHGNGLKMYSRKRVLATSRDTLRALCNLPYSRVWAGTDPWRSFEAHTIDICSRGIGYARSALSVLRAVLPRMCSGSCVSLKSVFVPDGSYDKWQLLC